MGEGYEGHVTGWRGGRGGTWREEEGEWRGGPTSFFFFGGRGARQLWTAVAAHGTVRCSALCSAHRECSAYFPFFSFLFSFFFLFFGGVFSVVASASSSSCYYYHWGHRIFCDDGCIVVLVLDSCARAIHRLFFISLSVGEIYCSSSTNKFKMVDKVDQLFTCRRVRWYLRF